MSGRALIRSDDLRRWARVAREEGVTINGTLNPGGTFSIVVSPAPSGARTDPAKDFDDRLDAFGAR